MSENVKDASNKKNFFQKLFHKEQIDYAKNNIKEEYLTSLELVIYYSSTFHHIMGVSFENIF